MILLERIAQMCEKRKLASFSSITDETWNASEEHQLICLIKEAERQNLKPQSHKEWDSVLDASDIHKWMVQNNNTNNGCEENNNAPHSIGNTPLQALKMAWQIWSVPPILILNSDYYVKNISITDVL